MRLVLLASAACLLSGTGALAQSMLGQSDPGGAAAVPHQTSMPTALITQKPEAKALPQTVSHVAAPAIVAATPLPPPTELVQKPSAPPKIVQLAAPAAVVAVTPAVPVPAPPKAAPAPTTTDTQPLTPLTPAVPTSAAPSAAPASDVPPPAETQWVPATSAEIGVLNKVDGSTKILTIPVGGQATTGNVTIAVQACVVRPAGALPNAAVFVTLQTSDEPDDMPIYKGWVVRSVPGATDAETADTALRIIGCS